jgi:hypothetical protein
MWVARSENATDPLREKSTAEQLAASLELNVVSQLESRKGLM